MANQAKIRKRPPIPKKLTLPVRYKPGRDVRVLSMPLPDMSHWQMLIQAQADMEYLLAILGRYDRKLAIPIPPAGTTLGEGPSGLPAAIPLAMKASQSGSDYPDNDEIPPPLAPGDCDPTPVDLPPQITIGEITGILLHGYRRVKFVADALGGPQI